MTEHPNVTRLRGGYAAFAEGNLAFLNDLFAEDIEWHEAGHHQLSGDYHGRDAVFGFLGKLMEVTEGTFRADVHAVLADDEHGVALMYLSASKGGRSIEINDVHVVHMRDGKIVEFWDASPQQDVLDEFLG